MFYEIPTTLSAELDDLAGFIARHQEGELDADALKARRVPFGCYEQRRDGAFMVRVRATGGAVTPAQLRCLASLSARHRGNTIHVTTRQEFQIHDLTLDEVVPVMRDLLAAGLSTRGGGGNTVRNIIVSPDAGVGENEVFDPSPYAFALTNRLIAEGDSWLLPRKLKFAFSNSAADSAYAQFNDVGFIARRKDGVDGFRVYVAGGMGTKPEVGHLLHDFIPAGEVYVVGEAIKHLFDKHGNRKNRAAARLRFLWKTLGEERFREIYEAERRPLLADPAAVLRPAPQRDVTPAPTIAPIAADSSDFALWRQRFVEPQRQAGLVSVLVPVFLGNLANDAALRLADLLENFGDQTIRASFGQNLRLRNIPEAYLGNVWQVVRDIDTLNQEPRLLANAISCTGADTCKLGICLSKGALSATVRKLEKSALALDALPDFRLQLSGCPNTCGQHMLADLGFFGNARQEGQRLYPAYAVVAGSTHRDGHARLAKPIDRVAAYELPNFVADVLQTWIEKKDRYASFADYIDTDGTNDLQQIAARYRPIPDYSVNKNYYYDWGASEVFSLVGRGQGECSAGLFDLIDIDLKAARRHRETLAEKTGEDRNQALYQIALLASRALLVTRGIEPASDVAAFESFRKHFIEGGLIDRRFETVLAVAKQKDMAALARQEDDILALQDAVLALYDTMDNSLRFTAKTVERKTTSPEGPTLERDYRQIACPINFAKVKIDLESLAIGQQLKVLLADGEPIRNVPRSAAQEGHRVVSQTRQGEFWAVVIEKTHD